MQDNEDVQETSTAGEHDLHCLLSINEAGNKRSTEAQRSSDGKVTEKQRTADPILNVIQMCKVRFPLAAVDHPAGGNR